MLCLTVMRQQELSKITEEDTIHLEGLTAVVAAKEAIIAAFNKVTTIVFAL